MAILDVVLFQALLLLGASSITPNSIANTHIADTRIAASCVVTASGVTGSRVSGEMVHLTYAPLPAQVDRIRTQIENLELRQVIHLECDSITPIRQGEPTKNPVLRDPLLNHPEKIYFDAPPSHDLRRIRR